jgi:type IV pilus assembly protein PilQ
MNKGLSKLVLLLSLASFFLAQPVFAEEGRFLTNLITTSKDVKKADHDRQYQFLLKKMFNIKDIEQKIFSHKSKKGSALKFLKRYQGQGRYTDNSGRLVTVNKLVANRAAKNTYNGIREKIKEDLSDRGYVNFSKRPKSVKSITDYKRVTNSFFETNLRDALNEVSQQVDIPFLMDESIQGTVTVKFKDTPLDRALDMLLVAGGFDYVENDHYILIGFPQSSSPLFKRLSVTKVLHPVYVLPTQIQELLSADYKSFVKFSDDNNTIVITAQKELLNRITADIAAIDQRPAQLKLEVLIADITNSAKRKMGRDLWNDKAYAVGTLGGTPFDLKSSTDSGFTINIAPKGQNLLETISGTATPLLAGQTALSYFTGVFNAMEDTGEARVWATPSVVASDGKMANIDITTEQIIPIVSGPEGFTQVTTKTYSSGVVMRIVPRISLNGEINLDLQQVEVSTIAFTGERQTTGDRLPVKTQRRISTNVSLKDQETLIIGGLLDIQHGSSAKNFPGMKSDLLGVSKQSREARELVIFITPTLLHEHADVKKVETFL